jgi:hypothetical protein
MLIGLRSFVVALLLGAGIWYLTDVPHPHSAQPQATAEQLIQLRHLKFALDGLLPNLKLTPGAVRTDNRAEICSTPTPNLRHWSRERDDRILQAYGLPPGPHPTVEIDHLIPLELGGADDDANLWAQPRRAIEPTWNAEAKDRLENRLRDFVCAGELDVITAQTAIVDDWIEAYRRFVKGE